MLAESKGTEKRQLCTCVRWVMIPASKSESSRKVPPNTQCLATIAFKLQKGKQRLMRDWLLGEEGKTERGNERAGLESAFHTGKV